MDEGKKSIQMFHTVAMLTTVFAMMTVGFFTLLFSARSIMISRALLEGKINSYCDEALDIAGTEYLKILNEDYKEIIRDQYDEIRMQIKNDLVEDGSEEEALRLFRLGCVDKIETELNTGVLGDKLLSNLSIQKGHVEIDGNSHEKLKTKLNDNGQIEECTLEGVTFSYYYGERCVDSREYNFGFVMPYGVFYNGNDELFDYSLIGCKGIYLTGNTSSIVGNVYAGTHLAEEYRTAEGGYGERGIYGGINALATQVGILADKVISSGEINVKGSFVAFGNDDNPVNVYSEGINCINGIFAHTNYTVSGAELPRSGDEYESAVKLMEECLKLAGESGYYFDSANDEEYSGKYRKILSGTDVTISEDFTGVVITGGNVLIDPDCNIEGLVFAGDRIYIQGNNNIVSNRDILREMVDEELSGNIHENSYFLTDYIADMTYCGLDDPGDTVVYFY